MRIAILSALLAGCAVAGKPLPVTAPDGAAAFLVECRGSLANCHQAARAQCAEYLPIGDNRRSSTFGNAYGVQTVHIFEMTFRCR